MKFFTLDFVDTEFLTIVVLVQEYGNVDSAVYVKEKKIDSTKVQ